MQVHVPERVALSRFEHRAPQGPLVPETASFGDVAGGGVAEGVVEFEAVEGRPVRRIGSERSNCALSSGRRQTLIDELAHQLDDLYSAQLPLPLLLLSVTVTHQQEAHRSVGPAGGVRNMGALPAPSVPLECAQVTARYVLVVALWEGSLLTAATAFQQVRKTAPAGQEVQPKALVGVAARAERPAYVSMVVAVVPVGCTAGLGAQLAQVAVGPSGARH